MISLLNLSVYGEYGNLGLFVVHNCLRMHGKYLNAFGEYAERIYVYMEKTQRYSWRILCILSNYIIWDRLSQKTISRYCPFKGGGGDVGPGSLV